MSTYVQGLRSAEDEEWLEEALSVVPKPQGVGDPDILFGTDHSGDAAVHIYYPVSTRVKLTNRRISDLARFSEAIHQKARELPLDAIVYVRFGETAR